jgi:hypothetical protein
MNIGVYGHSMATWQRREEFSYITKLKDHFGAEIVNSGCAQCSEERILFDLKKTKKLDLAIILHSSPDFIFVPALKRDFGTLDKDDLIHKVPSGKVKDWFKINGFVGVPDLYCEWWESIPNAASFELLKQFDITPQLYAENQEDIEAMAASEAYKEWRQGNAEPIKKIMEEKIPSKSEVDFYLKLFDALELNKKYLYHHDLQMNRYHGALIQIDQYLMYKNIPTVHCLGNSFWYPKWLKFESGIVDEEVFKLQHEITGHYAYYNESENSMNATGNQIAFDLLLPLIDQALEKVK